MCPSREIYPSLCPLLQVVRPANQLQLSEVEMKEEHTRVLTANDPNGERCSDLLSFPLAMGGDLEVYLLQWYNMS